MCTVSWLHDAGGYQLLCNRDEQRARANALGPTAMERDGVGLLAPVDGQDGGSWLSVNQFGLTLCLLNGANLSGQNRRAQPRGCRSRGLLLLELSSAESATDSCKRASRLDLCCYAPFTLVALEAGQAAVVFEWDGQEKAVLLNGEPCMPLVSSSYDAEGVRWRRRAEFERHVGEGGTIDAASLQAFHASHAGGAGAYSPCMHRQDAQTVSFSRVKVGETRAEFLYLPGAPCQGQPGETRILALVR